ncbi:hypothetical protein DRF65_13605 [Chryseobacterium pennae]|uniref:Uncharacterized protein n=1 Tax=Chryseobacterium pennae TaxID=2258962 RepID=A0A3D9C7B9_9FLAO|nr:hypothetical protein [Chryseobacterium pennae]REC61773.1 hypothetical protein DRF65_13605 [Chryseobacterium pennae]
MRATIYISIIIFCLQACREKKETLKETHKTVTTDTAKINGVLLELIDDNGVGKLKAISGKYRLSGSVKIKSPCYFLRNKGKVMSYAYPQFNVQETIVILGDTKKESLNKIFGTEIQGILFKNDSIKIVGTLKNYSPINLETGVDEKDYWGFASGTYKN